MDEDEMPKSKKLMEINPDDKHVARQKRKMIPNWMKNDVIRERVVRTWQLHLDNRTPSEIVEITGVSLGTYYRDMDMAKEMLQLGAFERIEDAANEQIEKHKYIIRLAKAEIDSLSEVEERTANKSRAIADLLRVISEQEKIIEKILGIGEGKGSGRGPGRPRFDEGMPPPVAGPTIIFDVRTGTATTIEPVAPPTIIENVVIDNDTEYWEEDDDDEDGD